MEHNVFLSLPHEMRGGRGKRPYTANLFLSGFCYYFCYDCSSKRECTYCTRKRGKEEGDKRKIYGRPNPVRFPIDLHIKKGAPETKEGGKKSHGLRENVGSGSVAFCSKMQLEEGPLIIFAPRQNSLQLALGTK